MGLLSSRRRRSNGSFANRVPILRWFGPGMTTAMLVAAVYFVVTGKIDFSALDSFGDSDTVVDVQPVTLQPAAERPADLIRIATFNIQTFGDKKSSTRQVEGVDVMGTIAQVISNFDLVAIQEVRGADGTPIRRLIDLLNASGGHYAATISEPIGDEHYTESYAFVWDDSRVKLVQNSAYVVHDSHQRMYREPMVASFEARLTPAAGSRRPFRFTMINAHTDPDEVAASVKNNEINVLDDVFVRVRQYEFEAAGEEDCILLGDLNVDTSGLQELTLIPNIVSIGGDVPTNTRRTQTYDHILIDQMMTREYLGRFGVIDFQRDLGLSEQQALLISDHMPLWAEFSAYEVPQVESVTTTGTRVIR